ncbi:phosphatidylinositol-specific phospholipase C domain-containing protein [Viridibacillus sp. YIM B01967]|uniref:1-phosphatidylinositol phosphodiesterase n=1 Tax=Viridibacillus soli TaxID=2798301 RepID=A0ABS1HBD2_9BACL|nr:phosphatidylinositol-specific phospholipase C domain-containing protein [Viridibacillus soli]MBK3496392.1 phosphatidylinositol-specific phospholipase C domain-containing protein [Viridibacillus soli]
MKRIFCFILIIMFIFNFSTAAFAHEHSGYSHDSTLNYQNPNWMDAIDDKARLSELSIPGTHDSMAYKTSVPATDHVYTQSMSLKTQLNSGIRYLDIRCRYTEGSFAIHHGDYYLDAMFGDVLNEVTNFLSQHPSETILMRIKQEKSAVSNQLFNETLRKYMDRYPEYFWDSQNGKITNPSLGEMRGKIVILRNVAGSNIGIDYAHQFNIQDKFHLNTNWDLYDKWLTVKEQLKKANGSNGNQTKFINYLSGSGGSYPYFVASGHSSPGTAAPRLATGLTTPGWENSYPDFPRTDCFIGICTIAFEGTNILTTDYIANNNLNYTGIVVSDFPGRGLIDNVIRVNTHLSKSSRVLDGIYQIVTAVNNTSVLDLNGPNNVTLWSNNQGAHQKWKFVYDKQKSAYQIYSVSNPNLVLAWNDYQGSINVFGTPNQQKEEHYWILDHVGSNYYIIKNKKNPKLVLDVNNADPNNGSNIKVNQQHSLNSEHIKAQKFKLK